MPGGTHPMIPENDNPSSEPQPIGSTLVSEQHEAVRETAKEVHSRGGLRQHRGDVWRKTLAEPTKEVVECAPLRRR